MCKRHLLNFDIIENMILCCFIFLFILSSLLFAFVSLSYKCFPLIVNCSFIQRLGVWLTLWFATYGEHIFYIGSYSEEKILCLRACLLHTEIFFFPQVERTKSRPFASGILTPFEGLSFLGFQLLLGLGILLQLNNYR